MAQKLTLTEYLKGRGSKALTRIEAGVFGIPYPLRSGWPAEYAALEITAEVLEQLARRIASAKQSTADKARRGLEGVAGLVPPLGAGNPDARSTGTLTTFPGFTLRLAKRGRERKAVPRA
jgi:hypothetical protein